MGDVLKERDLWVHSFRMPPDSNMAIKMEVGIEDCLHIEFEYNKAKYVTSPGKVLRLGQCFCLVLRRTIPYRLDIT